MLSDAIKAQIRASLKAAGGVIPDFKSRFSQNKMIAEISKTLAGDYGDSQPILCVEAPTGTGKTMAYLLSAIPIAKARKKKLIISSANVALQEQLLFKDIPQTQKYCTTPFEYALVKGRSRYLCVRNLINLCEDKPPENPLFDSVQLWDAPPEKYQLTQLNTLLQNYSDQKWNGEIDDLDKTPDRMLWQKVACNRFTCTAKKCEFYSDCAFFKARQKIIKADVIIANHDLILADLQNGNTILPDVSESIFIFDEAHHLNHKALSHFALSASTEHIKITIGQVAGINTQICQMTEQPKAENHSKAIEGYLDDLTHLLKALAFADDVFLFNQGVLNADIQLAVQNLLTTLSAAQNTFSKLTESWTDYQKTQPTDKTLSEPLSNAIGENEQHLATILALLGSMLAADAPNKPPHSRWIERTTLGKKPTYILNSAQIDVSEQLTQLIWSRAGGVVLTSATLSSLGTFDRLNQQLGLVKKDNQYLRLPSPFEFEKVDFIIAKFRHNPTQTYEHTQEVAAQLLKRIDPNTGSLVLFASKKQMQMVTDLVEDKLGCALFVQGEYAKKQILKKHIQLRQQQQGSVIFGLDSFAEGVDLKGDNLTHVVIVKLRFSVPNSPIEKTTQDYLQAQNRNPFMEISLPDASLRLVQACGRLIRTETDTGKITIFDNRLTTKFYGKQLLNALPNYNIVIER